MSNGHLSERTAIADGMPGIAKAMAEKNNEACLPQAGMGEKEYRRGVKINVSYYLSLVICLIFQNLIYEFQIFIFIYAPCFFIL